MRKEFERILEETKKGNTTQLKINIGGTEYTRVFRPKERVIILGGGHISQELSVLAARLGFYVVVVDDREEYASVSRFPDASSVICAEFEDAIDGLRITAKDYVVIVTRAHQYDAQCIRAVLSECMPYYLGLLGSKRRTQGLIASLKDEGLNADWLDGINTPIGLDIGALTVEEIAVSITAQMIQYRRRDTKNKKNTNQFVEELFNEDVVASIVSNDEPKALLVVYDTIGSSPVKSGSFMTVSGPMKTMGTIGGGAAENLAINKAIDIIGTGKEEIVTVDMNPKTALDEGMICGGTMKIYIKDLG